MSDLIWALVLAFVVFDIVILIWIILRKRKGFSEVERKYFMNKYGQVETMAEKEMVLEMDKLLHVYLKKRFGNETMGDILKKRKGVFSKIDEVWFAHKLRNRIAHELDFKCGRGDFVRARQAFKMAFKDLGLLG